MEIRASLFEKSITPRQYYFGQPIYIYRRRIDYQNPAVPGKLLLNNSKLIFKAKFANAFVKDTLFIPNQQIIPNGEVEVVLDLRKSREIRKKTRFFHHKRIVINLKPHGEFFKENVKYLVFCIFLIYAEMFFVCTRRSKIKLRNHQ